MSAGSRAVGHQEQVLAAGGAADWRVAYLRCPAYATVGLPAYSGGTRNLQAALAGVFHGAKILVGAGRSIYPEDAQRVRAVRATINNAALMLDANCAYTVAEAEAPAEHVTDCDIPRF